MNYKHILLSILIIGSTSCITQKVDVLVVGGGASGTTAGLQSSRMGVKTLIIEETTWLGGMLTAAGVSAIDGNYKLPSGLFGEFRDSLVSHYGDAEALKTGWVSNVLFEPSVGNAIFQKMTKAEKDLTVWQNTRFIAAHKTTKGWKIVVEKEEKKIEIVAKIMIDATELGDVAKYCGVKYDIGMESREVCAEAIAPEKANDIIQDLTYVMILKDYGVDKTIPKPENYNPSVFYCSTKSSNCTDPKPGQTQWSVDKMLTYGRLPNGKYMINWPIEGNDYYLNTLEMGETERKTALKEAKNFSLCYLYYLQTELGLSTFGLADDEFPTADKFPMIPYHRESRRIHGLVRFNVNHVAKPFEQPEALYRTGIAVGDYPIDHHHNRYKEWEKLPQLHFYPVPSYNVPLGALIPKDVQGLIVAEKSISVSNILNGSTRLQPVVLQIGQTAGALSALSVKQNKAIDKVLVRDVQNELLNAGGYLMPYLDLKKEDIHFKAIQRIGATGILKGIGMNVGWSNETWFRADSLLLSHELTEGLKEFELEFKFSNSTNEISLEKALEIVNGLAKYYKLKSISIESFANTWNQLKLENYNLNRNISRKEFSVILDFFIQPFDLKKIDIYGHYN